MSDVIRFQTAKSWKKNKAKKKCTFLAEKGENRWNYARKQIVWLERCIVWNKKQCMYDCACIVATK